MSKSFDLLPQAEMDFATTNGHAREETTSYEIEGTNATARPKAMKHEKLFQEECLNSCRAYFSSKGARPSGASSSPESIPGTV